MHALPLVVLLAWPALGLWLFYRFSPRIAILANFFVGWAVLPGANYSANNGPFPYWILPVSLPASYFLTKATCLGFTALAGLVLFHRNEIRKLSITRWDLPIALWCLLPVCSSLAGGARFRPALAAMAYLALAWAMPYTLGRHFFRSPNSLLLAAKAVVLAGLLYIPICLVEFVSAPWFYSFVYGYEPFRWIGAQRYIGFRPIGFLEDGNQLGIWMASAALLAVLLWAHKTTLRIGRVPIAWASLALVAVTLMCQSVGSIVLLAVLLPPMLFSRRISLRVAMAVMVGAAVLFAALQFAHVIPWRELAHNNSVARAFANHLRGLGRGSLGWRLGRDESQTRLASQHFIVGTGQWNWWQENGIRPWDLGTLVFGMYGLAGVLILAWILIGPTVAGVWLPGHNLPQPLRVFGATMASLLLMSVLDCMLNAALILPYLIVAGALSPGGPLLPHKVRQPASAAGSVASEGLS